MSTGWNTYFFTLAFVGSLIALVTAHYYFKEIFELMPLELIVGVYSLLLGGIIASIRLAMTGEAKKVKEELQFEVARIIETIMKESFNQHLATKKVVEEVKKKVVEEVAEVKEEVRKEVASIKNGQGNMG